MTNAVTNRPRTAEERDHIVGAQALADYFANTSGAVFAADLFGEAYGPSYRAEKAYLWNSRGPLAAWAKLDLQCQRWLVDIAVARYGRARP